MRILKLVLFILMIFSLTGVVVGAGYDWIRPLSSGSSNCSNNYSHVNINDPSYFVSSINIKAQTDDKIIRLEENSGGEYFDMLINSGGDLVFVTDAGTESVRFIDLTGESVFSKEVSFNGVSFFNDFVVFNDDIIAGLIELEELIASDSVRLEGDTLILDAYITNADITNANINIANITFTDIKNLNVSENTNYNGHLYSSNCKVSADINDRVFCQGSGGASLGHESASFGGAYAGSDCLDCLVMGLAFANASRCFSKGHGSKCLAEDGFASGANADVEKGAIRGFAHGWGVQALAPDSYVFGQQCSNNNSHSLAICYLENRIDLNSEGDVIINNKGNVNISNNLSLSGSITSVLTIQNDLDVQDGTETQTQGDLFVDTSAHKVYIGQLDSIAHNTEFIFQDRLGNMKTRWFNAAFGSYFFGNFGTDYGIKVQNSNVNSYTGTSQTDALFDVAASIYSTKPSAVFTGGLGVGIGTNTPNENYSLHVEGNTLIDGKLFTNRIYQSEDFPHMFGVATTPISVGTGGVWYNLSFNTNLSKVEGNLSFIKNNTLIIKEKGDYLIDFSISIKDSAPSPNANVAIRIALNGIELNGSYFEGDTSKQNADFSLQHTTYTELNIDDELQMQFTSDDTTVSVNNDGTFTTSEVPVAYGWIQRID